MILIIHQWCIFVLSFNNVVYTNNFNIYFIIIADRASSFINNRFVQFKIFWFSIQHWKTPMSNNYIMKNGLDSQKEVRWWWFVRLCDCVIVRFHKLYRELTVQNVIDQNTNVIKKFPFLKSFLIIQKFFYTFY